ncbi:MAG TPA: hypothetical protein PLM79_09390 [Syntrophobacteraceae bacterium]|nr:hypothetical protein [Syntrophobacteraceae bacterium]
MLLHPSILAILVGALLVGGMILFSVHHAARILRYWDLAGGSELQLELERGTYLVSTVMSYALGFQVLSLFLFIFTVDDMSPLFVGAMCAAGTLNANAWGYPTLILKVVNSLSAGLWLILNYTDNRGYDYPLIRIKYKMLLWIAPGMILETILQSAYFLDLKPDVITSCCGTLFTSEASGAAGGILVLPRQWVEAAFYAAMGGTLAAGVFTWAKGKGAYLFSGFSCGAFLLGVLSLISFISLYYYELPTHHCPFCVLHPEYHYVGYGLYGTLLAGAVTGMGTGVIEPFREVPSLAETLPGIRRALALVSVLSYAGFVGMVTYQILFSNLKMGD